MDWRRPSQLIEAARPGDRVAGQKGGPDHYMPAGRDEHAQRPGPDRAISHVGRGMPASMRRHTILAGRARVEPGWTEEMWTHTNRKPLLSFLFLSMFLLSAADASGLAPQKRRLPLLPQYNVVGGAQNPKKFDLRCIRSAEEIIGCAAPDQKPAIRIQKPGLVMRDGGRTLTENRCWRT